MLALCLISLTLTITIEVNGLDNGVARTPPMGWLSWTRFGCEINCEKYPNECINEQLYKDMADRMAADGYKDVGYEYVNIDDCWSEKSRDSVTHKLVADKKRFPSGIKGLADYVHSKGLKLGIYGDIGPHTCAGYPSQGGSGEGYHKLDAQTFAEWEIDSLKMDACGEDPHKFDDLYPDLGRELNATGRKIVYCGNWAASQIGKISPNYTWVAKNLNVMRIHNDITDMWSSIYGIIDFMGNNQDTFVKYQGPGAWFDPDQIVVGGFGLSLGQMETQMALWSIWASPLYMSNDLRHIRPEFKEILQNKKVIAINQDSLGIMGQRTILHRNHDEVWAKPVLPKVKDVHSYAVVYLNVNNQHNPTYYSFPLTEVIPGIKSNPTFDVEDLFGYENNNKLGKLHYKSDNLTLRTNPSGCVRMVKLTVVEVN